MTIISNIHIGLSAWQTSHSYSIGNRVSSSGNAYQAISAGNSGATSPSGTASDFFDGALHWKYLSAIDYTSLNSWQASIASTLTANVVGQIWNDGNITTTAGVAFLTLGVSGSQRTVGSFTITLTPAPGESFRDKLKGSNTALSASSANGVCFTLPSGVGGINYFDIYDSNVIFDGLQFIDPFSTSNSTIINVNASTVFKLNNCIVDGYGQPAGAYMVACSASLGITNCLVIDRIATGTSGVTIIAGANDATSFLVNTTIIRINPTNGSESIASAYLVNNAAAIARNNIVMGWTNPYGGLNRLILVDHNVLSASSLAFAVDNGNNTFSATASAQFISATTDFHLIAGSAALGTGSTDTTHVPSATDILGYSRPQGKVWAIGAAEFTMQLVASPSIGTITGSANITTANFASLQKTLIPSVTITAQQSDQTSGTISIGTIKAVAVGSLANILSTATPIGPLALTSGLSQFVAASAAIPFGPASIVTIASEIRGTAISTIGIMTSATAGQSDLASTATPVGPITSSASFGQVVSASAMIPLLLSATGALSPSIVLMSALDTITLVPVFVVKQDNFANATVSLGAVGPVIAGRQDIVATSVNTIAAIVATGAMQQSDLASTVLAISPRTSAAFGQSDLIVSAAIIPGISLLGNANQSYVATASPSIGPLTLSNVTVQSDQLIVSVTLGAIVSVASASNPYPAAALVAIGPVTALANALLSDIITATVSIGAIACHASGDLLLAASSSLTFTAVVALDNPYPITAVVSLAPISSSGSIDNFTPLLANALATVALTPSINALQSDNASALLSLTLVTLSSATNAPKLRVSQAAAEVLASGGGLRVSQIPTEVLTAGGALRVSQTAIEVLARSPALSAGRVSQTTAAALAKGNPRALVSQVIQEVLTGGAGNQNVRISQVMTEVLVGGTSNQNVRISQVVLEALISAIPLQNNGTTFIMA